MAKSPNFHKIKAANKKKAAKNGTKSPKSNSKAPKAVSKAPETKSGGWDGVHAQFLRVETYAKEQSLNSTGKKQGSAQTAHAVLQEAVRNDEFSQHVDGTKTKTTPPLLIFDGLPDSSATNPQYDRRHPIEWADDMENYIDDRLRDGEKQWQRRIKGQKDKFQTITMKVDPKQKILLAGVLSMPEDTKKDAMIAWVNDSVKWLKKKYPNGQLKGVLLHQDEACPHLHFYAIPNNKDCDVAHIHDGMRAKKAKRIAYKMGKLKEKPNYNGTYKAAMVKMQEDYYQSVGIKHNLKRRADNPGRRVPPHIYSVRKWYQRRLIELQNTYEESISDLEKQISVLREEIDGLKEVLAINGGNSLNIFKIKNMIRSLSQREANLELMGYKIELEKDKNLKVLEIKRESAEEQAEMYGEWSIKNKNLGVVHQMKINRIVNENLALEMANDELKERVALYEAGFDSPEEAKAYNDLAYQVYLMEKEKFAYDKREYRIKKTLAAPFYEQRTLSTEDLAYMIQKFIEDFFKSFSVEKEKKRLAELEEKRQQQAMINQRIANYDDFGLN